MRLEFVQASVVNECIRSIKMVDHMQDFLTANLYGGGGGGGGEGKFAPMQFFATAQKRLELDC